MGFAGQQLEVDIDALRWCIQQWVQQPIAAVDLLHCQPLTGEIQRDALAGMGFVRFAVLRVQAADAHAFAGGAEQ